MCWMACNTRSVEWAGSTFITSWNLFLLFWLFYFWAFVCQGMPFVCSSRDSSAPFDGLNVFFLLFECARFSALGARVMVRGIGAREKHGVGWNYSSCFICTGSILFLLRIDPVRVWKFSFLDVTCLGLVESWRMVLLSCRVLAMCRQSCLALVWLAGENIFASFFEGGPSFCFIHYASSDLAIHSLYVIK